MAVTYTVEVQCTRCKKHFEKEFYFEDSSLFSIVAEYDHNVHCPECGKMTSWSKENINVVNKVLCSN